MELQQMQSREASLVLDQARLTSYINKQKPDFQQWKKLILNSPYGKVATPEQIDQMVVEEKQLLDLQNSKGDDKQKVLQA